MSYLGLNLDSLCWEMKSLIQNNYGDLSNLRKEQIEEIFELSKSSILDTFGDIINQNKEDVVNDVFEELQNE